MGIFRRLLGINELERRIERLERKVSALEGKKGEIEDELLELLSKPMTTRQLAKMTGKSRAYISLVLNRLEREGRIREVGRKKRQVLYQRV